MNWLTHGLENSGADIEYKILKEDESGYMLAFFNDYFYLPKYIFSDNNIIKSKYMFKFRLTLREAICNNKNE